MGCPDWPKCFGLLIPPTSEDQITWKQGAEYAEGQMVIANDTLWQATTDHISEGSDLKDCGCWEKYEKHDYAHFNAKHTWIEYINRLLGALSGIPIILLFSMSLMENKKKGHFHFKWRCILRPSSSLDGQGRCRRKPRGLYDYDTRSSRHHGPCLPRGDDAIRISKEVQGPIKNEDLNSSLSCDFIPCLVLGTQVREQIDGLLEHGVERVNLISELPSWWKIHRSAVWPLMHFTCRG